MASVPQCDPACPESCTTVSNDLPKGHPCPSGQTPGRISSPLDFSQAFGAWSPPLPPNLPQLLSVSSPSRGLPATRLTLNSGHFSLSFVETLSIVLASSQIPTLIPCSLYSYNFSTAQGDPKQTYLVSKLLPSVTSLFLPAPLLPQAWDSGRPPPSVLHAHQPGSSAENRPLSFHLLRTSTRNGSGRTNRPELPSEPLDTSCT